MLLAGHLCLAKMHLAVDQQQRSLSLHTTKQIGACHASMSVLQPSGKIVAGR